MTVKTRIIVGAYVNDAYYSAQDIADLHGFALENCILVDDRSKSNKITKDTRNEIRESIMHKQPIPVYRPTLDIEDRFEQNREFCESLLKQAKKSQKEQEILKYGLAGAIAVIVASLVFLGVAAYIALKWF
jgi:hypothetical protein